MQKNQCNKICLFLPNLHGGGAERVLLNLAKGFVERGLEVDMVLSKAAGQYLVDVSSKVRIIDLKSHRVLACLPRFVSYLRSERPPVILSTMRHSNIVAILALWLSGISAKLTVLIPTTLSIYWRYSPKFRSRLSPLIARCFYRLVEDVVAVSHGVGKDLIRNRVIAPRQLTVIYDPVVTPEIFTKAREMVDHPWFTQSNVPIILGVGRLAKEKDFATLIEALAIVRKEHPSRLVILGEGDERPYLESLIKRLDLVDDVSLPGFVENPFAYIARASVFVLSSLLEGLPNALIQAMAMGTPVVSTDCQSGPREILNNGEFGALVPVGDVDRLSQAILETLQREHVKIPTSWLGQFELHHAVSAYLDVLGYSESGIQ